jgi:hypothetical protein
MKIMNFKLKTPKSKDSSLILSYVTLSNGNRFVYSTGEKIPLRLWDTNSQLPKKTKSQNDQVIVNRVNLKLDRLRSAYLELDHSYKTANKLLNKEILKQEFDILFKGAKKKEIPNDFDSCFADFFELNVKEGNWAKSTTQRYKMIHKLLKEFEKFLIKRFKKYGGDPRFKKLSERLEDLRDKAEQGLISSIEFVKELCKLAKETLQIEKEIEDEINNKSPKAALTELFQELKSEETPAVVERIVNDIDAIVKLVRYDGWQTTPSGEREVQKALRKSLLKYKLHKDQALFERAYGYIKEYY